MKSAKVEDATDGLKLTKVDAQAIVWAYAASTGTSGAMSTTPSPCPRRGGDLCHRGGGGAVPAGRVPRPYHRCAADRGGGGRAAGQRDGRPAPHSDRGRGRIGE